jgi:pyruvate-formate lyase
MDNEKEYMSPLSSRSRFAKEIRSYENVNNGITTTSSSSSSSTVEQGGIISSMAW